MKRLVSAMLLGGMIIGSLGGMRLSADDSSSTPPSSGSTAPSGGGHHGGAFMKACGDDVQKFCSDKKGKDLMACMKENNDKLSSTCQDTLKKMHAHHGQKPATPPQGGSDSSAPAPGTQQ